MSNNDKCVICNAETPYTVDIHIKLREHYVEGAGQLCTTCSHTSRALSYDEIGVSNS